MTERRVAIVVPARNEAMRIAECLQRLDRLWTDNRVLGLTIVVLANNCSDDTAGVARRFAATAAAPIRVETITLDPPRAHAGWARRLAFEAGLAHLSDGGDGLMSTDADTLVEEDWLVRSLDYLDAGYDAVAGFARLNPRELRRLPAEHRRRLSAIRRYENALAYLKAAEDRAEPWPRHFYEGGASIALTLEAYGAIGGAPTPRVGEDKALFEALRAHKRRIRHPKDVQVLTSCRLDGRAPEGAADTLARWGEQKPFEGLWGVVPIAAALKAVKGEAVANDVLTFETLAAETATARAMVRALRPSSAIAKAS